MAQMHAVHWTPADFSRYFREAVEFLHPHRALFDFKMTRVFFDEHWSALPLEWITHLSRLQPVQLNRVPFGEVAAAADGADEAPSVSAAIRRFAEDAERLSCRGAAAGGLGRWVQQRSSGGQQPSGAPPAAAAPARPIDKRFFVQVALKKRHEIERFAHLVATVCDRCGAQQVLDVGAGLAKLDVVLSEVYALPVVAVESAVQLCCSAVERNNALRSAVRVLPLRVADTELSFDELRSALCHLALAQPAVPPPSPALSAPPPTCLVALHCCGDLGPALLKFACSPASSSVSTLVLVGCCYHLIDMRQSVANFPLSASLRQCVDELNVGWISHQPLRLAARETRARWSSLSEVDHERQVVSLAYRAVVELSELEFAKSGRLICPKGRMSAQLTFDEYVELLRCRTSAAVDADHVQLLRRTFAHCQPRFRLIPPLLCLQLVLQPVLETLVILDRVCFCCEQLHAANIDFTIALTEVFDDFVSPRNIAIVLRKLPVVS